MPKTPISPDKAKLRMAALCAKSEQCEFDIRRKLASLVAPEFQDEIIDFLIRNSFIDNHRYARNAAAYKANYARWGKRKIRHFLSAKRISEIDIEEAIEAIDEAEYLKSLHRVAISKAANLNLEDFNHRGRLMRSLLQRGFEPNLISAEISQLRKCSEL